jgi:hypothetical protein
MNTRSNSLVIRVVVATVAIGFNAAAAHAATEVKFIKPENFMDMPFSHSGREDVLKDIQRHFEKLAEKLPTGQELKIDVQDIDLAGRIEPQQITTNSDFRILRGGADWPSMKFSYRVEADGKVIKSGNANVNDMNYLRGFNRYSSSEPLRYEKKMLDEWFRKEIIDSK